jgi:hypothetical protein
MDLKQLSAPFPASDVEWRVQSSGAKGDGSVWARVLAYITNRAIMERLDDVCGPANWRNEFRHGPDGAVLCGISIRLRFDDGSTEWVTKWDGAENTDVEAVKGGLSGAMKRAGYQWGIGRYLYQLEEGFAKVSDRGAHYAKTKDGKSFKWDAPDLPTWALPGGVTSNGSSRVVGEVRSQSPASMEVRATQPTAATPTAQTATDGVDDPSCPKCGGRMWDNRLTKRNPKAPDFKCRSRSCDGVVWPAKKADAPVDPSRNSSSYADDFDGPPPDDEGIDLF